MSSQSLSGHLLPGTGRSLRGLSDSNTHLLERRARSRNSVAAACPLLKGATCWVSKSLGRRVRCSQGTLWLTVDDCPQDFILDAGVAVRRFLSRQRVKNPSQFRRHGDRRRRCFGDKENPNDRICSGDEYQTR